MLYFCYLEETVVSLLGDDARRLLDVSLRIESAAMLFLL